MNDLFIHNKSSSKTIHPVSRVKIYIYLTLTSYHTLTNMAANTVRRPLRIAGGIMCQISNWLGSMWENMLHSPLQYLISNSVNVCIHSKLSFYSQH